jgi:2-dehydro-3-deoxyphosphogluconate aldolase / (4S)-4-hydroxy-2-oxoglutarate aldolase
MESVREHIGNAGLVPVVVIADAKDAVPAAKALLDGGLDVMEITLRTEAGIEAIKYVSKAYPEMLVGAGTVLSVDKAREAVEAGAKFIVTPGLNEKIVNWCQQNGIDIFPGCVTPTEIDMALNLGLDTLKFFPASVYGGVKALKALNSPYGMIKFVPTGGIDNSNLSEYADKPFIHAIGGGWLCESKDIKEHKFENITKVVREAVEILLGFELTHIGINPEGTEESMSIADKFSRAFNFKLNPGNSSIFAGKGIEVNKETGLGKKGHIAVKTNDIKRAAHYLSKNGYGFDWNTAKQKNGSTIAVYLKDEIGGFAVHLVQKN